MSALLITAFLSDIFDSVYSYRKVARSSSASTVCARLRSLLSRLSVGTQSALQTLLERETAARGMEVNRVTNFYGGERSWGCVRLKV